MGFTMTALDRAVAAAGRRGLWWPHAAGLVTGTGLGCIVQGYRAGWLVLIPGLVLLALRPAGTTVRNHLVLREARRMASVMIRDWSGPEDDL